MGMFLDAFFLQIFEHFSSTPIPPHPRYVDSFLEFLEGVWRVWRGGEGGVWVGWDKGGVYLDSFLEFLEGVWRVWRGRGVG